MKEYKIAAAAIIIHEGKILLVRYNDPHEKSFLIGPGGGVQIEENLHQAVVREVKEETGIDVKPIQLR